MVQVTPCSHTFLTVALCGEGFDALPILDVDKRLAEFGGDTEGYEEVAEMVLFEGDDMLHSLSNVSALDHVALAAVIHEVANHCAMVGAQRCELLARAVETKVRKSLRFDVVPAVKAIRHEFDLMLQRLSSRRVQ